MIQRRVELTFVLVVCLLVAGVTAGHGESLWSDQETSDFRDPVAVEEGDILMIVVSESARASSESNREREKQIEMGGEANTSGKDASVIHEIASWIPIFGASLSGNSEYESDREADASGSLNTRMSVRVEDVAHNGVMKLKGRRTLKIDDEVKDITFVGYARQHDVRPDNTIPSDRIANAEIFFEGELGLRKGEARTVFGKAWKLFKNVLF